MTDRIDCYLWLNSDWAYLGADRLERIAASHGLLVRYLPVDLPEVYRRTGGQMLANRARERQAYRLVELKRWCKRLGIPLNPTPKYMCPNADAASLIVVAASSLGLPVAALCNAILRAEWCEDRDISDPEVLHDILLSLDMDAVAIRNLASTTEIARRYRLHTEEAVAAGVFGSPSYVFDGEMFWGQDRLDMLDEAIAAALT